MTDVISKLWTMSLQACVIILIVMIVRFFIKDYPKIYSYILWAVVGVRLLCPIWIELPMIGNIPEDLTFISQSLDDELSIRMKLFNDGATEQYVYDGYLVQPEHLDIMQVKEDNEWKQILPELTIIIYCVGVISIAGMYFIQYLSLKKRLTTSVIDSDNIWLCENIKNAFVMGVLKPRIYLPYGLNEKSRQYILKHEKMHIRNHDPIIRFIGIICVCLHWWNPFVWLAVYKMNQDMEMCCDEGFLLNASLTERKAYAEVLLNFAQKRSGLGLELAFGESNTEKRVKNVLNSKKKGIVGIIAVVFVVLVSGCSFFTENIDETTSQTDNSIATTVGENETSNKIAFTEEVKSIKYDVDYDIAAELDELERDAARYKSKGEEIVFSYVPWKQELELLCERLREVLTEEEWREFLTNKNRTDSVIERERSNYIRVLLEEGFYDPFSAYNMEAQLIREYTYAVASYLGEKVGQKITVPTEEYFYCMYIAGKDTDDIHSALEIEYIGEGVYNIAAGIKRAVYLEGVGKEQNNKLYFEDTEHRVKGEITVNDIGVELSITESGIESIKVGEVIKFSKKY